MAGNFGEVLRGILAEADLVRLADGDGLGGVEQQPGAVVGYVCESGSSGREGKCTLAGGRLSADQDAFAVALHTGRMQREHVALREQHVSEGFEIEPSQADTIGSGRRGEVERR